MSTEFFVLFDMGNEIRLLEDAEGVAVFFNSMFEAEKAIEDHPLAVFAQIMKRDPSGFIKAACV